MTNYVVIHTSSNFGSMTHEEGENVHRMRSVLTHFLPHFFYSMTLQYHVDSFFENIFLDKTTFRYHRKVVCLDLCKTKKLTYWPRLLNTTHPSLSGMEKRRKVWTGTVRKVKHYVLSNYVKL